MPPCRISLRLENAKKEKARGLHEKKVDAWIHMLWEQEQKDKEKARLRVPEKDKEKEEKKTKDREARNEREMGRSWEKFFREEDEEAMLNPSREPCAPPWHWSHPSQRRSKGTKKKIKKLARK